MAIADKLDRRGKKKLLALDGGGIRGMITVEVLGRIESLLRERTGRPELVLGDWFDYVAGTSTGAIIATCVSLGMSVDEIRGFYLDSGKQMFDRAHLLDRLHYKFNDEPLALMLKQVIGEATTLGSDRLRTLLMLVLRNATTDSPWPLSNNPGALYNRQDLHNCNLELPLWRLVRASTAAPTYFPPEQIPVGKDTFVFVDGGVTMYNNPAFQLFLMATVEPYRLEWETGEDRMLVVSVGTGTAANANRGLRPGEMNLLYNAGSIPSALMFAALNEQDFLCRVFGKCLAGPPLDGEVEDMIGKRGPADPKLFTYLRYNAELTREGLDALGLSRIQPRDVQQLDSVDHVDELAEVGRRVAERQVESRHFAGFASPD
ncbi:MAG: patatin-like phospholipase family protein [Longimicrobiaceae bacterium]